MPNVLTSVLGSLWNSDGLWYEPIRVLGMCLRGSFSCHALRNSRGKHGAHSPQLDSHTAPIESIRTQQGKFIAAHWRGGCRSVHRRKGWTASVVGGFLRCYLGSEKQRHIFDKNPKEKYQAFVVEIARRGGAVGQRRRLGWGPK
jgi:hypothetical protein